MRHPENIIRLPAPVPPSPPGCDGRKYPCPVRAWPRTECGVGGWSFIAPNPADSARNSPLPVRGPAKQRLRHGAAADISGADKKDGFHSARRFKVSGERRIVNAEITAGIHVRWPAPLLNPRRAPEPGLESPVPLWAPIWRTPVPAGGSVVIAVLQFLPAPNPLRSCGPQMA